MLVDLLAGAAFADDALYAAVENSDLAAVERALAAGGLPGELHASTVTPGRLGRFFGAKAHDVYDTPLHEAVSRAVAGGSSANAVLERLIAASQTLDVTTADVGTPLSVAVGAAGQAGAAPVVRRLLDAGASAEEAAGAMGSERAGAGDLPKSEAAVLKLLFDHGARPITVMCGAAGRGDEVLVRRVLDGGAPVDGACGDGTPLLRAVRTDHLALATVLIGLGADRGASSPEGHTLFDDFNLDVKALLDAAPVDPRTEAALLVGWAHGRVDPSFVTAYPFSNVGREPAEAAIDHGGAAAFIDGYAAVGGPKLAALIMGPFRAPLSDSSWTWPCPLAGGALPREVDAWVPGGLAVASRAGPVSVWTWEGGEAGFLRGRLGGGRLAWLEVPPACDEFEGAVKGLPRGVVRMGLGAPEAASPALDVWSAEGLWSWAGRSPWYVVAYVDDVAVSTRVEWRRW